MGKYMTVPYFDLIHLRKDFYKNDFFGESGVAALKNIMEVIVTTDQGIVNAVKNSAVIKWILKFKSVLQPKDVEMQVKEFIKNYLSISNEGGAAASDPRYDLEQVKDNNYVPNALQMKEAIQRLYGYFGVNDAIVQNKYKEDEWTAFYESELEPIVIQLSEAFTAVFFTGKEIGLNNKIVFEPTNLTFASMQTKLRLVDLLDRGIMNANEIRQILNMPPVEGGDEYVRRLDTAPINGKIENETDEEDQDKVNNTVGLVTDTLAEVVNPDDTIASVSLNGAQITGLLAILESVVEGVLDHDSAVVLISSAFPFTVDVARKIVGKPKKKKVIEDDKEVDEEDGKKELEEPEE